MKHFLITEKLNTPKLFRLILQVANILKIPNGMLPRRQTENRLFLSNFPASVQDRKLKWTKTGRASHFFRLILSALITL